METINIEKQKLSELFAENRRLKMGATMALVILADELLKDVPQIEIDNHAGTGCGLMDIIERQTKSIRLAAACLDPKLPIESNVPFPRFGAMPSPAAPMTADEARKKITHALAVLKAARTK